MKSLPFAEESGGLEGEEEEEQHDVDDDKHLLLLVVTTQIWKRGSSLPKIFVKVRKGGKRDIVYVRFVLSFSWSNGLPRSTIISLRCAQSTSVPHIYSLNPPLHPTLIQLVSDESPYIDKFQFAVFLK